MNNDNECPYCNLELVLGLVKTVNDFVFSNVWFCPECIYPFYSPDFWREQNEKEVCNNRYGNNVAPPGTVG